jgi:hypothetical protein
MSGKRRSIDSAVIGWVVVVVVVDMVIQMAEESGFLRRSSSRCSPNRQRVYIYKEQGQAV